MDDIASHLEWCARRGLSHTYMTDIRGTLRRCERQVGPLLAVSAVTLENWWDNLPVGPATRSTYAAHLSSFFRWAIREGARADNPTDRFLRPRVNRRLPRPAPADLLAKAIANASNPERTWLLLATYAGLRACEVAGLHADDLKDGVLVVRNGKGGKQRVVPLHPLIVNELRALPKSGWLFPGRDGPMTANTVSKRMSRYLHGIGATMSFHQCRHAFGTAVYRQSKDLRLTQELLGHSSPQTTALYAAFEPERAAGVVRRLEFRA